MKKNSFKTIACLIALISIIFSICIIVNEHHIEICHEEHCHICDMIYIAKSIQKSCINIANISYIILIISIILNTYIILQIILNNNSLIKQNIQLNE